MSKIGRMEDTELIDLELTALSKLVASDDLGSVVRAETWKQIDNLLDARNGLAIIAIDPEFHTVE